MLQQESTLGLPLAENLHPLSNEERALEHATLERIGRHFKSSTGSRREIYDAMTELTPIASDVSCEAVDDGLIRGWWVRPVDAPSDRAILFIHGGAYMLGSARGYRGLVSQIAIRTGIAAFALEYPLAPEHPFPGAFDTSVQARRWLGSQGFQQIALVGDSCGRGLILATLNENIDGSPRVACAVVFSPWTDLALSGPSFNDPATIDPIFQPAMVAAAASAYLGSADPKDPRASPLYGVPEGLPPLLVQVGSHELLLDDARHYAKLAALKGGKVQLDVFEGLHHVFQRAVADLPSAGRALNDAASFVREHWLSPTAV